MHERAPMSLEEIAAEFAAQRGSRVTSIRTAHSFLETRQRLLLEAALVARGA